MKSMINTVYNNLLEDEKNRLLDFLKGLPYPRAVLHQVAEKLNPSVTKSALGNLVIFINIEDSNKFLKELLKIDLNTFA